MISLTALAAGSLAEQRTAACDEPFGRELKVAQLRVERLPSASSGLEPVESSRVEYRMTNDGIATQNLF